ncbi:SDR family oxidoreductase [Luteitalea sp. TBR-22]|uniref:SDR family oxidoreductase n=1 Tax=Luteitalea sp. TBR-22 TaxID=2802971 RepID=UPI001EF5B1B5|nr:SDR family oxidoreductase [Luteitalea sp. TBR-22]
MPEPLQHPTPTDPRPAGPRPEYPQAPLAPPGLDADMTPQADHGETSYRGLGRLQGRKALITGGDSGIGRAVAIAFAREGADVLISYLPEEERDARETCRWVEEAGRRIVPVPGDIQHEDHCQQLVARAFDELGGLDIVVNNAAYQVTHDDLASFTTEELDRSFRTNVYAMFWICRAALPRMQAGSVILNTASIQAYDPSPNLLTYSPTKAAIVNFTKGLSQVAMEQGVRVNAVAPGPVWTPLIPSTMPEEKVRSFGAHTSFGRAAQPAELAPLYVFLASNEARFVTGEVYGATGGQTPF